MIKKPFAQLSFPVMKNMTCATILKPEMPLHNSIMNPKKKTVEASNEQKMTPMQIHKG